MNQQQLQTARAALWHQSAAGPGSSASSRALVTYDDAAAWIGELALFLFLPRHAQLPAPAPSFVEACMGSARALPPPDAIAHATELADRLVDARVAVPLNLMGAYTEQPDFLVACEALPWVAAIRGDRQWKTAPGGRTSPLVVRTWEALDREGESTAVELRELLGRELTEAAVLRALIELWTGLRAMPISTPGQPTRWTLLKHRHPTELATAANTGQATALSALLSIYLRSAVAATAEEAEVFLSPLTSRSRIRDVLHGMVAARQFGTMSVASQTLLFVEGSLPEIATETEQAPPAPLMAPPAPRRPFRNESRREPASKWGRAPGSTPREQHAYTKKDMRPGLERPRENRPDRSFNKPPQKPFRRFDQRPFPRSPEAQGRDEPKDRRAQPGNGTGKLWQRSGPKFRQESADRPQRPWQKTNRSSSERPSRPSSSEGRPVTERPRRARPPQFAVRKPFEKNKHAGSENRRPGSQSSRRGPSAPSRKLQGARKPGQASSRFTGPGSPPSRASRPRPSGAFAPRPSRSSADRSGRPSRPPAKFGSGGPGSRPKWDASRSRRPGGQPARPGQPFKKAFKKPFRKVNSSPAKQNPRKNRNQEETPE